MGTLEVAPKIIASDPVELLRAENRILELAARNVALEEVLELLAVSAEQLVGDGVLCSILLLDEAGRHLLHGAAPSLPAPYNEAIHGIEIGPEVGSCGTAATTGCEVIVRDIATHPYWANFKDLALGHGLRACWSTPILSSRGEVLGTFAMYYQRPAEPDSEARTVVDLLSRTAALVIERAQLHESLTRKIAEHTKTEKLLLAAHQAARLATWSWNLKDDSITFASGSAEIFGKPLREIRNREELLRQIHPEDRQRFSAASQRSVETRGDYEVEYRILGGGETRWILSHGRPVCEDGGECTAVVGVSAEITERRRAEEALHASEKLAATGRLAATIAHEINNPLEAVTNFIYLARHHPDLPPSMMRYLDIADQELARVTHIAQQTLGFYRDTTGPSVVDLAMLIEDVRLVYQRKLKYKNIELQTECGAGLTLKALQGELRQVLSNLLANAIDACGENARIRIRARRTTGSGGSPEIRLTIADNGCGIDREIRSRLFTPFFTTKQEVGTGLGLWVSQGIVGRHGGRLRFRSACGERRGTVFTISLPVEPRRTH